jgi:DNA-binding MarR family transcriptional regulator
MVTINKNVEVARLFFEVNKIFKHSMRKSFEDIGITLPQMLVISTLTKFGEMKITELSRKINLSTSTISGIIDRLEKQQLVVRTRSEEDRRIVYVKATPKFGEIHKGLHAKVEESFKDLLNTGTPEEIEKIVEGLNALKKILNDSTE